MILKIERKNFTEESTIGRLSINGVFQCFTLEDPYRKIKVPHETCIPPGVYEIVISYSQRFDAPLPLLLRVPNFDGIRFHWGNSAADTSGCILLGTEASANSIRNSKVACSNLFKKIFPVAEYEKLFVEIFHNPQS